MDFYQAGHILEPGNVFMVPISHFSDFLINPFFAAYTFVSLRFELIPMHKLITVC